MLNICSLRQNGNLVDHYSSFEKLLKKHGVLCKIDRLTITNNLKFARGKAP